MTNFVCMNCGYRFGSQEETFKRRCTNCGENSVKKEPDAASLLEEADEKNGFRK
ncbi:MAG: hypothetical protein AABY22_29685 [Nanoarchaeota archaeon]